MAESPRRLIYAQGMVRFDDGDISKTYIQQPGGLMAVFSHDGHALVVAANLWPLRSEQSQSDETCADSAVREQHNCVAVLALAEPVNRINNEHLTGPKKAETMLIHGPDRVVPNRAMCRNPVACKPFHSNLIGERVANKLLASDRFRQAFAHRGLISEDIYASSL